MEKEKEKLAREVDLLQLLRVLLKRAWIIALAALACAGIGYLISRYLITPKYQARASFYVDNRGIMQSGGQFSSSDITAARNLADTYIVLLQGRSVLTKAIERSHTEYTYDELRSMMSVSAVNNTEIFEVVITSESPGEAFILTNAIADVLPGEISDMIDGSTVKVVDYPVVPNTASSPDTGRNTVIGAALGIILSGVLIIIFTLSDNTIRDEDHLIETYDIPVLAAIPSLLGRRSNNGHRAHKKGYGEYLGQGMKEAREREIKWLKRKKH